MSTQNSDQQQNSNPQLNTSIKYDRPLYLGFNWKMNPDTIEEARRLLAVYIESKPFSQVGSQANSGLQSTKVRVFVADAYYTSLIGYLRQSDIVLGIQDISDQDKGSFTSQTSGAMAESLGVDSTLVGHSETRKYQDYSPESINHKLAQALVHNMETVWCIGYNKNHLADIDLDSLRDEVEFGLSYLATQVDLADLQSKLVIAYEPIWAIGTGKTASSQDINQVFEALRSTLKKYKLENIRLLYGGSVNKSNIDELVATTTVDGFLIGGAGLDEGEVRGIITK